MPSTYLTSDDLALYDVPTATTQQIVRASGIIDAYLKRPEGLVWGADFMGLPAYMVGLSPLLSLTLAAAVSPGTNVVVPFAAAMAMQDALLGEVLVLDRATPSACEAAAIIAVNATAGTITLDRVRTAHAQGATAETGLAIMEERPVASKRSVTRVSRSQLVRLQSGLGRYSYGRRSDQVAGLYEDVNLLATVQAFGGPVQWVPFDVSQAAISTATNEIWVPAGLMIAYFSDVRVRYIAGFSEAGIPAAVKQATASIIGKIDGFGDSDPAFKVMQAGGTKLERFTDSALDTDTKALLASLTNSMTF